MGPIYGLERTHNNTKHNIIVISPKYVNLAQWLECQSLNQELSDSFIPCCLSSLSCMNIYLTIDSSGYTRYLFYIFYSAVDSFHQ